MVSENKHIYEPTLHEHKMLLLTTLIFVKIGGKYIGPTSGEAAKRYSSVYKGP
jgi:hypothetical protein